MKTKIQKGESKLRPRARIIKTIGDELISNDVVAVIELVKNSYDADASSVRITFKGPLTKGNGGISVFDNGSGMDLPTIKGSWMEPATNFKVLKRTSGKDRKILGEKGIGRFASAKLAKQLELITKVKDDNEIRVIFNWEDFGDKNKYLDEIDCFWEVRAPTLIKNHGTLLRLNSLAADWDYEKIRELKIALSRLINPVSPVKGFKINLNLPDERTFDDLRGNVEPPETIGKPDYYIKGNVDSEGKVFSVFYSKKNNKEESVTDEISIRDVKKAAQKEDGPRKPTCAPFSFEFRVWNRENEAIQNLSLELKKTIRDIKRDLDEAAGISIYRDNFRVLPYGEPKNDWLRLDFRRVQNPTRNLSNNQIIGYVSVSLDTNIELKDQSNREGIVDSTSFSDLKECIKWILSLLEIRRYKERRPEEEKVEQRENLFAKFDLTGVKDVIARKLPGDEEASQVVAKTENSIKEGVKAVQEVLARYRRLSTLGQLLDVVLHDGNTILYSIDSQISLLDKEFKKKTVSEDEVNEHIRLTKQETKTMSLLFKRLEPFGGRRRGRPKEVVLEKAIADIFELHHKKIEDLHVSTDLPKSETIVTIDESEFETIIVNLLQNSLYWLEKVNEANRKIKVTLTRDDDKLTLIFSDSGPGIKQEDVPYIFDPYFSTKPDGVGLGLTIVGELVTEYNGTFELIDGDELNGATFRLTFTRRI